MKVIFLILFLWCSVSWAQVPTLDVSGATTGSYGAVKFNNPSAIGQKNSEQIDYSEIRGRCFWDNDWNPAIMILNGGRAVKMPKIKLNFYTNTIHYIDIEGNELVMPTGLIKKIGFFSISDTLNAKAFFENIKVPSSNKKDAYIEVLNDGDAQLLKRVAVSLVKQDYDPSIGKDEYRFTSSTDYYIRTDGVVNPFKSFNKSSLFAIIKPTEEYENWLSSNKNKLKNQDDVVEFLAFVNSTKK